MSLRKGALWQVDELGNILQCVARIEMAEKGKANEDLLLWERRSWGSAHRIANETVSKQAFTGLIENLQNKTSRRRPL